MVSKNTKIAVAVIGGVILLPSLVGGRQITTGGGGGGGFFGIPFGIGEPVNPNSTSDSFGVSTPPVINIYESAFELPTSKESSTSNIGLSNAGSSKKQELIGGYMGGIEKHRTPSGEVPPPKKSLPKVIPTLSLPSGIIKPSKNIVAGSVLNKYLGVN